MAKSKEVIDYSINISANTGDVNKLNESLTKTDKAVDQLESSTKSLKVQLREATLEQQKLSAAFGATSTQAIAAAKNVANIKDEIEFQKDLVKSYNPDEKFRKLTQTAGVAALALGGVKDGFAALGIESKTLDKVIGSAQAILGVTAAVSGMSDAYAVLTASKKASSVADLTNVATTEAVAVAETEATVATWSFNAALLANPIVLITAGIVAAIAVIYAFVKITSDAVKEEEKARVATMQLEIAIENQARAFEKNNKYLQENNNHKLALLRASGASEAQIYKETEALKLQEIQLAQNYRNEAIRIEQRAYDLDRSGSTDATKDALKKAQDNLKKANDLILKGFDDVDKIRNDHEVAVVQASTDARLKAEQEAEKARQKELDAIKEFNKKKLEEEAKAASDLLAFKATVSNTEIERKTEAYQADRDNIQRQDEEITAYEEQQANNEIEFEKKTAEEKQRINQIEFEHKRDLSFSLVNLGQMLIDLFSSQDAKTNAQKKKNIHINHAIALGDIGLNTARAVMAETAKGIPISIPLIAADIAMGVVQTGAAIASTNKALKAVGGGSADSGSSAGSASALNIAPQIGFQNSSENQIATSISKSNAEQKVNVTVLASDITDVQNNLATNVVQNSF